MPETEAAARNFLQKNNTTSLAIVSLDQYGVPDSVSYWKDAGNNKTTERFKGAYKPGILIDVWV